MPVLVSLLIGYLMGSIPFGLLLTRAAGAGDIRTIGSGNIGATNVLRSGHKGLAAATLMLDAGKGAGAVWLAGEIFPLIGGGPGLGAAIGALAGHCFPVWLGFRGGKGVATLFGVCLALGWLPGLVFAGVWGGVLAVTRISSLAGMAAAMAMPLLALAFGQVQAGVVLALLAVLVLFQHRANIARLRAGTEPKLGADTAEPTPGV